jgi:hypothetical protein
MNDEIRAYLARMAADLEQIAPAEDPNCIRLENFLKDFATFVVEGGGTDEESERLEREIEWVKENNNNLPWRAPLPSHVFDTFTKILRAETPKYRRRVAEFVEAHSQFVMSGQGDEKNIREQIVALTREGFLSETDAATFRDALALSKEERSLAKFARPPLWKRIFG